jgi:hypothetical protein
LFDRPFVYFLLQDSTNTPYRDGMASAAAVGTRTARCRATTRVAATVKRDPAEHVIALDDPPVRASVFVDVDRLRRIRPVCQPRHLGREPGRRIHLIGRTQPEAVLVQPGTRFA